MNNGYLPNVSQLLNKHSLPIEEPINKMHFCEPYPFGKGKQLLF